MELTLPKAWFKTIHSVGDNIIRGNKKSKALHPYDLNHKKSDAIEYIRKLQQMPQNQLIETIMNLEDKIVNYKIDLANC